MSTPPKNAQNRPEMLKYAALGILVRLGWYFHRMCVTKKYIGDVTILGLKKVNPTQKRPKMLK